MPLSSVGNRPTLGYLVLPVPWPKLLNGLWMPITDGATKSKPLRLSTSGRPKEVAVTVWGGTHPRTLVLPHRTNGPKTAWDILDLQAPLSGWHRQKNSLSALYPIGFTPELKAVHCRMESWGPKQNATERFDPSCMPQYLTL